MPTLVSQGRRYRVSFMSFLRGNVCDESLPYRPGKSALRSKAGYARERVTEDIPWSSEDDKLLEELKTSKVSWRRISMVMDSRPIEELKGRWYSIRNAKLRRHEAHEWTENVETACYSDEEYDRDYRIACPRKERHVSFSPLVTGEGETDEDDDEDKDATPPRPKTKRVYYIDDDFALDDVLLLHRIASEWKKDRWTTISTRFNEITGRSITPEEAKSVVEN